jgi:hypothetical protein
MVKHTIKAKEYSYGGIATYGLWLIKTNELHGFYSTSKLY